MKPPAPLLDRDREHAFEVIVAKWQIERLDTKLGTADVAKSLRMEGNTIGHCGPSKEDGPYSDGKRAEWWTFWVDCSNKGVDVRVLHRRRDVEEEEVIRAGRVTWNELANRATHAALALRSAKRDPLPGEQMAMI